MSWPGWMVWMDGGFVPRLLRVHEPTCPLEPEPSLRRRVVDHLDVNCETGGEGPRIAWPRTVASPALPNTMSSKFCEI